MLRRMRKKAPPFVAVAAFENGRIERAVKHFIMASNLGHEDSMKALWKCDAGCYISNSKDNFLRLRTYQYQAGDKMSWIA